MFIVAALRLPVLATIKKHNEKAKFLAHLSSLISEYLFDISESQKTVLWKLFESLCNVRVCTLVLLQRSCDIVGGGVGLSSRLSQLTVACSSAMATKPHPQRILVTGGAGFLGSHVCERLVDEGHDVICLDNFFTSQKDNIRHLFGRPNFEFVRHDVTEPIRMEVDKIWNLACPASPVHYQYNPIKTMKTSWLGASNMLGMAKRCNARILQSSTSEVLPL